MSTTKKCEYCDKVGVPIMPLRYAVAPAQSSAPTATGPSVALSAKAAHYTTRLLRSGYLYVYDEARDRWESYFVTPQAMFFKLAETPGIPPILPKKPFDCADAAHRAIASCITIRDAKNATNVWLGFSDVEWTAAVREKHSSADYRKRHMRCVNVMNFSASVDKKHCLGIHTVGQQVAEYVMDKAQTKTAFGWSPFPPEDNHGRSEQLVRESENLAPGKGFAVVLEDPVGITAELAALMQRNLDSFTNDKVRVRQLAVSTAITQIEAAVKAQARTREEAAATDLGNQMLSQPDLGMLFEGYRNKKIAQIEDISTVSEAEAKRAEDAAWTKYSTKFDQSAITKWRAHFAEELKAYDVEHIAPLATAHVSWMTTKVMASYYECNFDDTRADIGLVYAKTVQLCIAGTQDKAACFDLYVDWLNGDVTQKSNIILRALVLNLEKSAQDIQTAMKVSIDWRGLPFDAVAGNFAEATNKIARGETDAVGKLVAFLFGPIAKVLGEAYDGKVRAGMIALGLYTQKTFTVVEVTGGKKAFRSMLIRDLVRASGQPLNQRQMERAVSTELKRLKIAGIPMEGTEKKRFLLMVDPEQVHAMPQELSAQERAKWLASSIKTPEAFEALNLSAWREQVRNPSIAVMKGSIPYIGGLVSAVLQFNAIQKLGEDQNKAMNFEQKEAQQRLWAGIAAFTGTISETVGQGLEKIQHIVPRYAAGFRWAGTLLKLAGKTVGIAGALIMAWWDFLKAVDAKHEKQYSLMWAYGGSAVLGLAAAAALLAGWTGVGLILVALLIAVAVFIEYFKDNKIQDWLERCVWGHGPAPRYRDVKEEMEQLRIAAA